MNKQINKIKNEYNDGRATSSRGIAWITEDHLIVKSIRFQLQHCCDSLHIYLYFY